MFGGHPQVLRGRNKDVVGHKAPFRRHFDHPRENFSYSRKYFWESTIEKSAFHLLRRRYW
jgi:hypothetical protein